MFNFNKKLSLFTLTLVLSLLVVSCSSSDSVVDNGSNDVNQESAVELTNNQVELDGLLTGSKLNYEIAYDSEKWYAYPSVSGSESEYELDHLDGDVYALVIAERIEIPLESLREIAVENAKAVGPNIEVVLEETRTVNGREVLAMKMAGTVEGIDIQYYGYYTSGDFGTVQFVSYTGQNLADDYADELDELLNGLTIYDGPKAGTDGGDREASMQEISGSQLPYSISYDANKWAIEQPESYEDAEYYLNHLDGDVYAMIIPERVEIPLDSLKEIAIENASEVAPDIEVVYEETIEVDGQEVLVMKMNGTIEGIPFQYYGHYFSGDFGTIQFITYTSQTLADLYETDARELLEGISLQQ